jgi:uncharacterized membrane protein YGL010W
MHSFEEHMQFYREQHTTLGCKLTHMFGIPMIAASVPIVFFDWRIAVALFGAGWALQFIGHYVFQKNSPVFLGDPKNPYTYLTAIVFVTEEWARLLSGQPLVEPLDQGSSASQ